MKIVLGHNYYQQRGGEDLSFESNAQLLREHGHEVELFTVNSDVIPSMNKLAVAMRTVWNTTTAGDLKKRLTQFKPDVVHFTNTFPLLSPSTLSAAKQSGYPVVLDLRNYRHFCPGAYLLRDGEICEKCISKRFAWPAIVHRCYRNSVAASSVLATSSFIHRMAGTLQRNVDAFLTPTQFAKSKYVEAGFPSEKIHVKPNFVAPVPPIGSGQGNYAVFVGRLSPEKGVQVLLDAWQHVKGTLELHIVGDGELSGLISEAAERDPRIKLLGWQSHDAVLQEMGEAVCTIMPSVWYETFGRTIVEAFSKGCPVVASRLGCMRELVEHERTGLLFETGNSMQLAKSVNRLVDQQNGRFNMRENARREYLDQYTARPNYDTVMGIYDQAIKTHHVGT